MEDKQKEIAAIQKLWDALRVFSDATNGKAYRDKDPVEQDTYEIVNALFMELDKLKRFYQGKYNAEPRTKSEELTSKLTKMASRLQQGDGPVDEKVADDFIQALDLFDIASEAKRQGKTHALKDKYKNI